MQDIKVSIICTAYNHERYIEQAIKGFLMQETSFAFEILINDDASTDDTPSIIKYYENQYSNIFATYQSVNQYSLGKSVSNELFRRARGEYIAICEGDDFWIDKLKLQKQFDFMEANPEYSLCVHAGLCCYEDGVLMKNGFIPYQQDKSVKTEEIIERWLFPTASLFYRKSSRKDIIIPFKGKAPCGDYPLTVYLALQGKVYYFASPMCVYRRDSISSLSRYFKTSKEKDINRIDRLQELAGRINDFTGYKYDEVIKKFMVNNEYSKLMLERNINAVRVSKLYRYLSKKMKLKIFCAIYFPFILSIKETYHKVRDNCEYKKMKKKMLKLVDCENCKYCNLKFLQPSHVYLKK